MKPRVNPSVRRLAQELWDGHRTHRDLRGGTELSALALARPASGRAHPLFHRSKVAFVVLSGDRTLSPGELFSLRDEDFVVEYVEPDTIERDLVARLDGLYRANQPEMLMIVATVDAPASLATRLRNGWRRCFGLLTPSSLQSLRRAIVASYRARQALESEASLLGGALRRGEVVLLESLYDARRRALHFDVSGAVAG